MVYRLVLALAGRYFGRECRTCSEPISRLDQFGVSEGVCAACRA